MIKLKSLSKVIYVFDLILIVEPARRPNYFAREGVWTVTHVLKAKELWKENDNFTSLRVGWEF